MRIFFAVIGVLAWIWALLLLAIFSESGGEGRFIAAGIYAIVGILALGCERIIKTLEDIRDGRSPVLRETEAAATHATSARPLTAELIR